MIFLFLISITFAGEEKLAQYMVTYDKASQIIKGEIAKNRINVPAFRPKSCPLISVGGEDLYKKFKGIEEGLNAACVGSNKTALSSLNQSITDLDKIRKDYDSYITDEDVTKTPAPIPKPPATASAEDWEKYQIAVSEREAKIRERGVEAVMVKNVSTAINSISVMTENKDCKNSITREKVFNLISDIVTQTSSIGLLVPSPQGYMAAAGGIAVGSMLKIINELLKEEFDWSNRDARDVFLKMNCSFFDLKKEMDSVGLLHVRIAEHSEEIAKKKESLKILEPILQDLYKNESDILKKDKIVHQTVLLGRMGEANFRLLSDLNEAKILVEIKGPNMTNIEGRAEFLKTLFALHASILKNLDFADVGKYGKLYYLEDSKREFINLLKGAQNEDQFLKMFLTNSSAFKTLLDNFLTPIEWVYSYQKVLERKSYTKTKGIAAVISSPLFKYKSLIRKYENIIENYKTRIKFLNNITNDTLFSPDDDGTRIKANVIENFRGIEEKLYGKVGYSFNSYILKQVASDFTSFALDYKFMDKFHKSPATLSEKDRMSYCANAKRLQMLWGSSHALLNLGYDFMETNKDSFYKPLIRTKMFLFIPYRRSDQQFIFDNAGTAFEAKEMISKNNLDYKKLKLNSLGFYMVMLQSDKPKLTEAQKFIDSNKCAK